MHGLHARLGKNFNLYDRLVRYNKAIVENPKHIRGHWRQWCAPCTYDEKRQRFVQSTFREVHLDLGCGKGNFCVDAACRRPDVLFVGVDVEPLCIAYAAQKICEGELSNALVFGAHSSHISDFFAPQEIDYVYLNFPTPFPRKKQARERLVYLDNLLLLRSVLSQQARVMFKTDSYPLMQFAITQFERAGYRCIWSSNDARADRPHDPSSLYEEKLTAKGARVLAREYELCDIPKDLPQVEQLSLVDYLPQDLTNVSYVPHGMEGTFVNLINYEAHRTQ